MAKEYGTGWLHWFYRWRVPVGGLLSALGLAVGVSGNLAGESALLRVFGVIGAVFSGLCLVGYIALYIGYTRGRYFDLYAPWMYRVTLILLWVECIAAFCAYGLNLVALIGYGLFGVLNHIYFYHRRYLCFGIDKKQGKGEET